MRKFALFLLLGLAYAYAAISFGRVSEVYYDSRQYFDYGRNLLETGVYGLQAGHPDMHREPGYGFYLAGLFSLVRALGLTPDLASLLETSRIFWVKALQALTVFLGAGFCAFRGALPGRIRWPFFLLAVLSPSVLGTMREIYSEALAIPLGFLFLGFLSRSLARGGRADMALAALSWAALVLTKSYFNYASFLFLFGALALLAFRRSRAGAWSLLAIALAGILAQKGWDARNSAALGEDAAEPRLSIALAGKIARLDELDWKGLLPAAFAASVGTNFCDAHFGSAQCSNFDYRSCDGVGPRTLKEYKARFPTPRLADQAIRHDMIRLYFHRPLTQLFGNALELERMFFFESMLDSGTWPSWLQPPLRAWHVVGSLALWGLILLSWLRLFRGWRRLPPVELGIALVCGGILVYHAVTMTQITNVARYVFPVLPFLYYFAADGIADLKTRAGRNAWKN